LTSIIPYESGYASRFRELNLSWLQEYGLLETHDQAMLDDPEKHILLKGGVIFLATDEHEIIGSAVLLPEGEGCVELAKFCVSKSARGRGTGRQMLHFCLSYASAHMGASLIFLFTNHQLVQAIRLYESARFRIVPLRDSPFITADIRMEISLPAEGLTL